MLQTFETFGKYILLEKIQTGGMAEIYLARSQGASGVSKFIAIKRILPQFSEQHEFIEMFKDEAKIAVNLAHANIVSIHEFGFEKNAFYLAMDYVEGRNLRQILNKMKKSSVNFSIEQVLYIIKEVAAGLDHAHRCIDANTGKPLNIIHRDMSPQNVMVSFEGEVKVVDFGIAKAETQLDTTRAGTLKGKFGYMSPEQAEGQNVDLRTDIFALGIVLWELLANDRLFVANNEVNTLRKVRDCQIPSLRKINPNIPPELERIVSKALAKDRNLRYQTAAAFQRELSRFLNRQYPDFSPHDFSVFIKTLFAAEILESRKKMVDFAKFEMTPNTMSLPAPPTAPVRGDRGGAFTNSATLTESTSGEADFGVPSRNNRPDPRAAAKKPAPPVPREREPAPSSKNEPKISATGENRIQVVASPAMINTVSLSVDRSNYRERERERTMGTQNGGTYAGGNGTYYGTRSFSHVSVKKGGIMSAASLPIILIAVGVIAGSVAVYQSNPQTITRAIAGFLSSPIDPTRTNVPQGTSTAASKAPKFDVAISSSPSGAEVLIDGAPVYITPGSIDIEQNKEIRLMVRMPGYITVEQRLKIDSNKTITVQMVPEKVAYVDIHVLGAGEIFVDGKSVASGSPANGIAIRAEQEVLIKAIDPVTKASDEYRVRLGANERKKITLIPRAMVNKGR